MSSREASTVGDELLKYLVADSLELKRLELERKQRRKSNHSDVCAMGLHENNNCCLETGCCCAIQICGVKSGYPLGIQGIASFRLPNGFLVVIEHQEAY